ncbi:MAG: hypothetical protein HDR11_08715 [Lachnospiraceae bacterium]|nr:hypothetical protein [Lachnospiraceae bacterium]
MNKKIFAEAMTEISDTYYEEAARYKRRHKNPVWVKWGAAAACLAIVTALCILFIPFGGGVVVTAYTHGTGEEIPAAGAVMSSGTISDGGEMTGHPLMFYISGKDIVSVRFSCKNQQICFMDWTEKRDEYGNAKNFTVIYGEDESEYDYLTIDWVPNMTIRELTDNADSTIAALPEEMRSDIIVMEITFANGKTVTKAITISLLDDGTFFAAFGDYKISEADSFVKCPDSEAIPRDILYAQGSGEIDSTVENTQVSEVEQTKWGITLSVENVTPAGLTLVCTQSGGIQTGQLQTGSFYKLLVLRNETWQEVPYLIEDVAWKKEAYSIPLDDRVAWEIKWESLYGELPAGTYRIVKPISDFRGSGDYDTEECWAEFEIK